MIPYQIQFLESFAKSLDLVGVKVGRHLHLQAHLVTHLDLFGSQVNVTKKIKRTLFGDVLFLGF